MIDIAKLTQISLQESKVNGLTLREHSPNTFSIRNVQKLVGSVIELTIISGFVSYPLISGGEELSIHSA